MHDHKIGQYLEKLRLSCGYSLRKAALLSGLSHGYIRDVELGVNRKSPKGSEIIPTPQTLSKFADAYNADFNELMRIAGHIQSARSEKNSFKLVEINLYSVLYIRVDDGNLVSYHLPEQILIEEKSLHEYMILEEKLENRHFFRVHSGVYANLAQIRAFDEKNSRIYFDENMEGKYVDITWMRASKYRTAIKRAIIKNADKSIEIKLAPVAPQVMVVRNIVE